MEAASESKESHIERTATEPRDSTLHTVVLRRVDQVNESIRLFRLGIREGSSIKFLSGQWLDTFVPGISKPGGFTITSPPFKAALLSEAYIELAVQKSSSNPPAVWLWDQPVDDVNQRPEDKPLQLQVRVGGSFVWPPQGIDLAPLRRVVFVAGGVGVNPLMSIISHLASGGEKCPYDVQFLYSTKKPAEGLDSEKILFMERLAGIYGRGKVRGRLRLFLTGVGKVSESRGGVLSCNEMDVPYERRRMTLKDFAEALGPKEEYGSAVVYVCGVPSMTDEFVEKLMSADGAGLKAEQVRYEKWW